MFQGFAARNHVAMKITVHVLEHYGRYLIICGAVRDWAIYKEQSDGSAEIWNFQGQRACSEGGLLDFWE